METYIIPIISIIPQSKQKQKNSNVKPTPQQTSFPNYEKYYKGKPLRYESATQVKECES